MSDAKKITKNILYHIGAFDALRHFQKKRVIILMYHRFSDKPEPFKIQKDVFEKQVRFLKKKYNFISLSHYAAVLAGKRNDMPPNPMIVTIDDGYWDNYVYAYPILKKYYIPATIFIATDFISERAWLWSNKLEFILKNSKYNEFEFPLGHKPLKFRVGNFENRHRTQLAIFNYCRTIPDTQKDEVLDQLATQLGVDVPEQAKGDFQPLKWEEIKEMAGNGIDFGSHTCSHPIMSRLSDHEIERELSKSKMEIEKNLGKRADLFCYPNGQPEDISQNVAEHVRRHGYKAAVSTVTGLNGTGPNQDLFMLKRISIATADHQTLSVRLARG